MSTDGRLQVAAPGDREIVLSRTFDAPAGLVFDALTTPRLLRSEEHTSELRH